jgi:hypothetical protein
VRKALAALLVLGTLVAVPAALADGDPASDWLLTKQTFVPQDDGVPPAYATQLANTVSAAKARGYAIRVALLGTKYDMGSVYSLWRQPTEYSRFLGKELYFLYKGRLLVVFPNGLATSVGGKPAPASQQAVVSRIAAPGRDGAALASAATRAVVRLAADHGAVIATPPLTGATKNASQNRDRVTIAAIALVILAALAVLTVLRRGAKVPR